MLVRLGKAGLAREFEVPDVIGQEVGADVGESGAIFRELADVVIAAVADDAGAGDEFLAPPVEIDRGQQLTAWSEDQEADEGLVPLTPGLTV